MMQIPAPKIVKEVPYVGANEKENGRYFGLHKASDYQLPVSCQMAPQYGSDVVQYTISNSTSQPLACVLYRGVTGLAPPYYFGNAFGQGVYYSMGIAQYYDTTALSGPIPVNENAMYFLASLYVGNSQYLTCFVFVVPAGGSVQVLEGGIPDCSLLIDAHAYIVSLMNVNTFCETYSEAAVLQYESQTGISVPSSPNPYAVSTVSMLAVESNIPSNEIFPGQGATAGPCSSSGNGLSCVQQIENGVLTGNIEEILSGIECLLSSGVLNLLDVVSVLEKKAKKKLDSGAD